MNSCPFAFTRPFQGALVVAQHTPEKPTVAVACADGAAPAQYALKLVCPTLEQVRAHPRLVNKASNPEIIGLRCPTHATQLMLGDIGRLAVFSGPIKAVAQIVGHVIGHGAVLTALRATPSPALLHPVATRFACTVYMVTRYLACRTHLVDAFRSPMVALWFNNNKDLRPAHEEMQALLEDKALTGTLVVYSALTEAALTLLRLLDSDEPMLHQVCPLFFKMEEDIKAVAVPVGLDEQGELDFEEARTAVLDAVDGRRHEIVSRLARAAYMLNTDWVLDERLLGVSPDGPTPIDGYACLEEVLKRVAPGAANADERALALQDLRCLRAKGLDFQRGVGWDDVVANAKGDGGKGTRNLWTWALDTGKGPKRGNPPRSQAPQRWLLAVVGQTLGSQAAGTSALERWQKFVGLIKTKQRNRLNMKTLVSLATVKSYVNDLHRTEEAGSRQQELISLLAVRMRYVAERKKAAAEAAAARGAAATAVDEDDTAAPLPGGPGPPAGLGPGAVAAAALGAATPAGQAEIAVWEKLPTLRAWKGIEVCVRYSDGDNIVWFLGTVDGVKKIGTAKHPFGRVVLMFEGEEEPDVPTYSDFLNMVGRGDVIRGHTNMPPVGAAALPTSAATAAAADAAAAAGAAAGGPARARQRRRPGAGAPSPSDAGAPAPGSESDDSDSGSEYGEGMEDAAARDDDFFFGEVALNVEALAAFEEGTRAQDEEELGDDSGGAEDEEEAAADEDSGGA